MRKYTLKLENLSVASQCHAYALAYLESADILTLNIIDTKNSNYAKCSVAMGLARHAVELFLKAALLENNSLPKNPNHKLELLAEKYDLAYPEFKWEIPFLTEYLGYSKEDMPQAIKSHEASHPSDQLNRYPMNKELVPWPGTFSFEAESFKLTLRSIREDFERLGSKIFGSNNQLV